MVVLAPISEELAFRGILFSRWATKWNYSVAIGLSSLVFGVLHFPDVVGATVFGILMCTLYAKTGSLIVPIVVHSLNNLVFAVLAWILPSEPVTSESLNDLQGDLYWALWLVILASPWVFGAVARWWPSREDPIPYLRNAAPRLPPEVASNVGP